MPANSCININLLWGKLLIEELVRLGIVDFCIAPGSRSTPLVFAASKHEKVTCHTHFDERGLGYYALGLAKRKKQGVAIITTSGGAVANLHPSVVEAYASEVPLVILSADRPDELIDCGANQAITQPSIFQHSVIHQINFPAASTDVPACYLLTSIDQAIAQWHNTLGPIHINCMYREPFYTATEQTDFSQYTVKLHHWQQSAKPYTRYHKSDDSFILARSAHGEQQNANANQAIATQGLANNGIANRGLAGQTIKTTIGNLYPELDHIKNKKVLVICGQLEASKHNKALALWVKNQGWPLLVDCQSSLKGHPYAINYFDQLLHIEPFKELLAKVDVIIQFGSRVISKRLLSFIENTKAQYWLVAKGNRRLDPYHNVTERFMLSVEQWLHCAGTKLYDENEFKKRANERLWGKQLKVFDNKLALWLDNFDENNPELSEYQVVRLLSSLLPKKSLLFLGNSMAIRLFDMFAKPSNKAIKNSANLSHRHNSQVKNTKIFTNRGASGIDGIIATATGIATAKNNQATTLLIGDTSFLHDLNSLALTKKAQSPLVIIVLNNDGGAIFNLLPVPQSNNMRSDFYQMPHGLTFKHASELFDIAYYQPQSIVGFEQSYQAALSQNKASIIEVIVPSEQTTQLVKDIGSALNALTQL